MSIRKEQEPEMRRFIPATMILEVISPNVAVKRGLPPGEYAELNPRFEDLFGHGAMDAFTVARFGNITNVQLEFMSISPRGNIVVKLTREGGPKVTLRDYWIYWLNRIIEGGSKI